MKEKRIALIGLGAIGAPIADIIWHRYGENFGLIASGKIRQQIENANYNIYNKIFSPNIISNLDDFGGKADLILVCVKNYQLDGAIDDIAKFVGEETIIFPLQNGIYSYNFFQEKFKSNVVLKGYMQGPNTEFNGSNISYKNPGTIHIGSEKHIAEAIEVYNMLNESGFPVCFENDINHMVWKKWMLNVAGNSITALTNADYNMFKESNDLKKICRTAMEEFVSIAAHEGVQLNDDDIDDIMNYYVSYNGDKKTSMLVDVINKRKTENDYLAGYALKIAESHNINVPVIYTLYYLMKIKENIYLKG